MPLERRQIAVNFAQGLDSKSDPKQVQGKVLALENGVFTSPGRIKKRNGFKKAAPVLAGAQMVAEYKDELVAADGSNLYSYSDATGAWENQGVCRSVGVSRAPVWRANDSGRPSAASLDGMTLSVYDSLSDTSGAHYTITDDVTGQEIVSHKALGTFTGYARVVAANGNWVIFYITGTGDLKYVRVASATPTTISAATTVEAAIGSPYGFDVTYGPEADRIFIVWSNATKVQTAYVDSSFALSAVTTVVTPGTTCDAVGIWLDTVTAGSDRPVIGYAVKAGNPYYAVLSTALATVYGPTAIETGVGGGAGDAKVTQISGYSTDGVGYVYYSATNTSTTIYTLGPYAVWMRKASYSGSTAGTASTFLRSVVQWSKWTTYGSRPYFVAAYPYASSGTVGSYASQSVLFVIDDEGHAVARIAQQDAWVTNPTTTPAWYRPPVEWVPRSASTFAVPIPIASRQVTTATSAMWVGVIQGRKTFTGIDLAVIDFENTAKRYQTAELGNVLHINGGMLMQYDGNSVVEQGFHYWPIGGSAASATGTGLSAGDYYYRFVYEWTDAQGNVHVSAPSAATKVTISAGASQAATVTIPTLRLTEKTQVQIRIYRTLVNGNIFYLLTGPFNTLYLPNDPAADAVTYTDTAADLVVETAPLLYTQSEVDHVPGPPADSMVVYRNRLLLAHSESPNAVWYSKQVVPGSPVAFNDTFIQNIDPTNGPVTAMGWLDDKLAVFKRDLIFYFTGTGPAPDGTANDFSTPIVINTNSGCIAPKSIVTADDGIMYQSAKGIYLLTRSLEDVYIGAGVEAYNAASVVASVMAPNTNEVRFCLDSGVVLVWDYFVKQWSVFTFAGSPAIASATAHENVLAYVADGQVWQENPGVYLDDTATYALKVKTAWIQLAGLQGFQRAYKVLILGDYASAHTLNVKVYYDFDDGTAAQTATITPTSTKPYQYRLFLARQKCEALQLELYDSAQTGTAEAFDLSAVSLEIGAKRGLRKMESGRSY